MSRIVVGRIFWKELRTQRSLWIGVTCLVIGIQTLITTFTLYYRHQSHSLEEFYGGLFFSAYLGATLYAIASGAASFSEETEGNTAVLLRTMPMTRSDAFAGKWGYGLASTGVLFLVLAVAAGMCCRHRVARISRWRRLFARSPPGAYAIRGRVESTVYGPLDRVAHPHYVFRVLHSLFALIVRRGDRRLVRHLQHDLRTGIGGEIRRLHGIAAAVVAACRSAGRDRLLADGGLAGTRYLRPMEMDGETARGI